MPAIAIYFNDPDGHELKFIGVLSGKAKSNKEKRVVNYNEWLKIKDAKTKKSRNLKQTSGFLMIVIFLFVAHNRI